MCTYAERNPRPESNAGGATFAADHLVLGSGSTGEPVSVPGLASVAVEANWTFPLVPLP